MHDFFGNLTTGASSTHRSLLRADTNCSRPADHSAYWVPTLYRGELSNTVDEAGNPLGITPTFGFNYYLAGDKKPSTIRPFPKGLRVIAGDPNASSPQDGNVVTWYCAFQPIPSISGEPRPPFCISPASLVARIIIPECSDGRRDSPDHQRHMAYARYEGPNFTYRTCPRRHPIPVPQLMMFIGYRASASSDTDLSSGNLYSLHADFFEGWRGRSLSTLIKNCLAADLQCGH